MNSKKMKMVNKLIKDLNCYFIDLAKKYDIKHISFTIFPVSYIPDTTPLTNFVRNNINGACALTAISPCTNSDENCHPDDEIVEYLDSNIFISYQELYACIIDCNLNFDKVSECMKFSIKHEIGHIIYYNKIAIGKSIKNWNEIQIKYLNEISSMPKLRKNASYENRLKWNLRYFELPIEKEANNAVGITKSDIIKECRGRHGYD